MRAALMERFGTDLPVSDVPDPGCPSDGVIVAVGACGVCRSDHHAWTGTDPDVILPHVMGHELAGHVVEVGRAVSEFQVGDRVTAPSSSDAASARTVCPAAPRPAPPRP